MTTTYNKDGAYIEVTVDGVVYRRSIKWEDVIVSFPTDTKLKIDRTYINDSDQLVLVLTDESEITLSAADEITEHAALPSVHHSRYLDSEAKAAAVQAGAITDGETKAPTHDAVYDVKVVADAAQTAAEVDADIQTHAELPTVHQNAPALIATHALEEHAHQNAGAEIAAHAGLPTVHQNAPVLIAEHASLPTVHQNTPALINTHAGQPTVHQNTPALIETHAQLPTVHQNAPALIQTHAELPTAHQNAPQLISNHAGEADPHTGYMLESIIDAEGDIIYGSGDNAIARLAKGDDDDVLTLASGIPSWAAPAAGDGATKEFFVPVSTIDHTGDEVSNFWCPVINLNIAAEYCGFSFKVPHDYTTLTSCKVIVIPEGIDISIDWTFAAQYAADGEARTTDTDTDTADGLGLTENQLHAIDVSVAFPNLAADDYVGARIILDAVSAGDAIEVMGLVFKYS